MASIRLKNIPGVWFHELQNLRSQHDDDEIVTSFKLFRLSTMEQITPEPQWNLHVQNPSKKVIHRPRIIEHKIKAAPVRKTNPSCDSVDVG